MKTKYIGMLTVMAMLSLTACNNNESLPQEPTAEGMPICFKVSTEDMQSRASHTDISTINELGVYLKGNRYPNKTFTFSPQGEGEQRIWVPTGEPLLWDISESNSITVYAFHPRTKFGDYFPGGFVEATLKVEEEQTAESNASDYLLSVTYVEPLDVTPENPAIKISFNHLMSLLNVVITDPTQTSSENKMAAIKTICVNGTHRSVYMELGTRECSNWSDNGPVSAYQTDHTANTATFQCILAPQTLTAGALNITFNYDGKDYKWSSTKEINFHYNAKYTLNLTINNTSAAQTQSMQSRSWGGNTTHEVIANSMN